MPGTDVTWTLSEPLNPRLCRCSDNPPWLETEALQKAILCPRAQGWGPAGPQGQANDGHQGGMGAWVAPHASELLQMCLPSILAFTGGLFLRRPRGRGCQEHSPPADTCVPTSCPSHCSILGPSPPQPPGSATYMLGSYPAGHRQKQLKLLSSLEIDSNHHKTLPCARSAFFSELLVIANSMCLK